MDARAHGEPGKKLKGVARALYAGGAKPEQAPSILDEIEAQLGLNEPEETGCWPDNWLALQVFAALGTQWNVGMGGAIGLRYEAIEPVLRMMGVVHKERAALFEALRIMENEALQVMRGE